VESAAKKVKDGDGWYRFGLRKELTGSRKVIIRLNRTPFKLNVDQTDEEAQDFPSKVAFLTALDVRSLREKPDFFVNPASAPPPGNLSKNLTERGQPRPKAAPMTESKSMKAEG
jgi:hypothetical protein